MLIGAHVSVAGGFAASAEYAASVGCECIQIFAKSPRRWNARPLDPDSAGSFRAACRAMNIGAVFTHAAYLINLGATDAVHRQRSIDALADEVIRARLLGAAGVAVHLGTDREGDPDRAATRIASAVDEALALAGVNDEPVTRVLLENSAGAGSTFGRDIAEIASVIDRVTHRELLGVCLDTCHAHASGIPLESEASWNAVVDEIAQRCGADALRLIHANDCLSELGSNLDRHAWIGEGTLGTESFAAMFATPALAHVDVVVEMPGEAPQKDAENVESLKRLRDAL